MRLARYRLVFEPWALVHCAGFSLLAQSATQLESDPQSALSHKLRQQESTRNYR